MKLVKLSPSALFCWLVASSLWFLGCGSPAQPKNDPSKSSSPSSTSSSAESSTGSGTTSPAGTKTKVAILLNWYPEAEHGGFYAAQVHKIFDKYNLDVDIQPGGKTTVVPQSLTLGRVQFGVGNADDVLVARNADVKLVALMAPIQMGPRCILVRADSGIKSFDQLKNVTLLIDSSRPYIPFLKSKGLLHESVKLAPYFGSVAQLVAGPGYAAQGYTFSEPFMARQQGVEVNELMMSDIGYNPYASLLVSTSEYVQSHEDICQRMVQASVEGWKQYLKDPVATNALILKLNKQGMEANALDFGAKALKPLCLDGDESMSKVGSMTLDRWSELADTLGKLKIVDKVKVDAAKAFDTRFLK